MANNPMTRREQIIRAVMEKLEPTFPVFRSSRDAKRSQDMPAVSVYWIADDPEEQTGFMATRWNLQLVVEVIDTGSDADRDELNPDGFPPDRIADETVAEVHRLVMADHLLGGLSEYVERAGDECDVVKGDNDIAAIRMGFLISYVAALKDLELAA